MRPVGPVARQGDYAVQPCPLRIAKALVARHHYAKGASNTATHAHCLVRRADGDVVGAALWLPPTKVAAQSVAGDGWQGVLNLSRLTVVPTEPKNAATLLLGGSMRLVMRDSRWHTLLTYADTRQGHTGAIYRATNWEYVGLMPGRTAWHDPRTGRQVAAKAKRTRTVEEMRRLGYERLPPSAKHKFVFRVLRSQ